MWRPEEWKTIPLWSRLYEGQPITSTHEAFEAGADAMLEAVAKEAGGQYIRFGITDSGDILIYIG